MVAIFCYGCGRVNGSLAPRITKVIGRLTLFIAPVSLVSDTYLRVPHFTTPATSTKTRHRILRQAQDDKDDKKDDKGQPDLPYFVLKLLSKWGTSGCPSFLFQRCDKIPEPWHIAIT
jgi:hypothetical protein